MSRTRLGHLLATSVCGLGLLSPLNVGQAHGAHVVVVTVPTGPAGPVYGGEQGAIDLEVIDTPNEEKEGVLSPGAVVAQRTARVHDAIVLTEPVVKGVISIPAGTLMVKIDTVRVRQGGGLTGPARTVWCGMQPLEGPGGWNTRLDCLESTSDASVLDQFTKGLTRMDAGAAGGWALFGPSYETVKLDAPAKYRHATEAELPRVRIGYALCKDGVINGAPPRFVSTLSSPSGVWTTTDRNACPFGEWKTSSREGVLTLDAAELEVSGDHYKVLRPIGAGQLNLFTPSAPVRFITQTAPAQERALEAFSTRPFVPVGPLKLSDPGQARHGGDIASVEVKHGLTGVLRYDVTNRSLFGKETLPAGTYVFGVPMSDVGGVGAPSPSVVNSTRVTWCAPRLKIAPNVDVTTFCFQDRGEGRVAKVLAFEPLMPISLSGTVYDPLASDFSVERKPAEFGARMNLTYVFDKWVRLGNPEGTPAAQIGVEVRVNGQMTPVSHVQVAPWTDGVYRLPVMGGFIAFQPVKKSDHQPLAPISLPSTRAIVDAYWSELAPDVTLAKADGVPDTDGALPLTGLVAGPPESQRPKNLVTFRCRVTDAPTVSDCEILSDEPRDEAVRKALLKSVAELKLNAIQRQQALQGGGRFTFKISLAPPVVAPPPPAAPPSAPTKPN